MTWLRVGRSKGFTLIELMVTLAILATVAAIAIPVYLSQTANATRSTAVHDGTAWSLSLGNALKGYTSFGVASANTTSAITLSAAGVTPVTITVTMIAPEPATPTTKTFTVTGSPGTTIVSSGMNASNWCFATSNKGKIAVFIQTGYVPDALTCAVDGIPDVVVGGGFADPSVTAATPTGLAVTNNASTAFSPNGLTWNEAICPADSVAEYQIKRVVGTVQTSTPAWMRPTVFSIPAAWSGLGLATGYQVTARCYYSMNGATVVSAPSGTLAFTHNSYIPANLRTDDNGANGAQNRLLWDTVICQTGYSTDYQVLESIKAGAAVTLYPSGWITGTTYDLSDSLFAPASTYEFKVQARCTKAADVVTSGWSAGVTINSDLDPVTGLGSNGLGGTPFSSDRLFWNASTCQSGFTANYDIKMVKKLGVTGTFNTFNGVTTAYYNIPASWLQEGADYGFKVFNRCVPVSGATVNGGWTGSETFTTNIAAPNTPVISGSDYNVSWTSSGCAAGTSNQSYLVQTSRSGSTGSWYLQGWTVDQTGKMTGNQGYQVAAKVKSRCVGPNKTSTESAYAAFAAYNTPMVTPSRGVYNIYYSRPSYGQRGDWYIAWSKWSCPAGGYPQYSGYTTRADTGQTNDSFVWQTSQEWMRGSLTSLSWIYWHVNVRCVRNDGAIATGGSDHTDFTQRPPRP